MLSFNEIRNGSQNVKLFTGNLIALDPGETTGYSVWTVTEDSASIVECGQLKTWPLEDCVESIDTLFSKYCPKIVVYESYRVYHWKTDQHSGSDVPTIQVIGSIRTFCILRGINDYHQSAQQAKQFVTDAKLESWGFWKPGMRHARDSIRHGAYYILFGPAKRQL